MTKINAFGCWVGRCGAGLPPISPFCCVLSVQLLKRELFGANYLYKGDGMGAKGGEGGRTTRWTVWI